MKSKKNNKKKTKRSDSNNIEKNYNDVTWNQNKQQQAIYCEKRCISVGELYAKNSSNEQKNENIINECRMKQVN